MPGISPFVVANVVMLLCFMLAAIVQYNDPDPWAWIAIYGAAAVACLVPRGNAVSRFLPPVVGVVAVLGFAVLLP